ncbi:MAG TPA: hypothetical protein VK963_04725 [Candidatus Saccharimonadales bacterium]|nr:hypothetical protein [Candidatus Saccharimonadales bacterium]
MKNITLSADEQLIEEMRQQAAQQGTTLNQLFRDWLKHEQAIRRQQKLADFDRLMSNISFCTDRKYTREEMNER